MNDAVLVRSTEQKWDVVLAIAAGVLAAVLGVAAWAGGIPELGTILFIPGVGLIVGGAWWWLRRIQLRRWARDTGAGFVLIESDGERVCKDADVISMALTYKRNYTNGELKTVTRHFVVWLVSHQAMPEELMLSTTYPADQPDPLASLIDRISERLYEQAKGDVQARRPVLGKGWRLENGLLNLKLDQSEAECPLAEIAAAEPVDNQLCIWRQGEEAARIKVPLESANAYILGRLLSDELARRPTRDEPPTDGRLGRIIFERCASRQTLAAFRIGTVLIGGFGLLLLALGLLGPEFLVWGGIAAAVAGLCAFGWFYSARSAFRCHEYGVCQRGLGGEKTLRYQEVEAFTYSAVRMFYNGAYTGTVFNMSFEPLPAAGTKTIRYSVQLPHADDELENLRDHIARVIASRMAERLRAGETVPWTPHLRFKPEGLEFEPAGFLGLGRKNAIFLPYEEIQSFNSDQGYFYIWKQGQPKPVVTEEYAKRNFYPGYYLFLSMTHLPEPDEAAAEAESGS